MMHDDHKLVEERIKQLRWRLAPHAYKVLNKLHTSTWEVPGEPVSFREAARMHKMSGFTEFTSGSWWGRPWSTWWIHASGKVPTPLSATEYSHLELRIDLGFQGDWAGNQAEGMVYSASGFPLKGVNPKNRTVRLTSGKTALDLATTNSPLINPEGEINVYIEAAANPNLGEYLNAPTVNGDLSTRSNDFLWQFQSVELVIRDEEIWQLNLDLEVLDEFMHELPELSTHRALLLRSLEQCADILDYQGIAVGAKSAREKLAPLLKSGANASAQTMFAIGHAHIDSAWLWPLRETRRKIARTFANVIDLADEYPDFHFACTSAQHYQWLKEDSPQIFSRLQKLIAANQWHVVGGTWIEPDTNLPSGESLVRQLTCGLRWFQRELGVRPECFWLPDSFGYSAALPQLAHLAGMKWFFTQKMSWNQTNQLPHHSFWWEGIDGTRIWTHFPPVNCYDSIVSPKEVLQAEQNFREKGRTPYSLLPFGYGDGGGGPVREMVERAARLANMEDAPHLVMDSPNNFYRAAIAKEADAPLWHGEMYLEFHRGVYTSNHLLKQGNRRAESMLSHLEFLAYLANKVGWAYPYEVLEQLWQRTLLLQFHDILPGTAIAWVNREARQEYVHLTSEISQLMQQCWRTLLTASINKNSSAQTLHTNCEDADTKSHTSVVNFSPYKRREVVFADASSTSKKNIQNPKQLKLVELSAHSALPLDQTVVPAVFPVTITQSAAGITLQNSLVKVLIGKDGNLHSIKDLTVDREVLPPHCSGGRLLIYPDVPSSFDAWELQAHYQHNFDVIDNVESLEIVTVDPLRAQVRVKRNYGSSQIVQVITLDADSTTIDFNLDINWQERAHVLKADFPLNIYANHFLTETQFGYLERPLHVNTSWDEARFEICAQRWLLLPEAGYGLALINESSAGHSVRPLANKSANFSGVQAQITLLRSPSAPDPNCDRGQHTLHYALVLDADRTRTRTQAARLCEPLNLLPGQLQITAPATLQALTPASAAILDTIKTAFDESGDLILRLHEDAGTHSLMELRLACPVSQIREVDLLEVPVTKPTQHLPAEALAPQQALRLQLHPFQILTLKVKPA